MRNKSLIEPAFKNKNIPIVFSSDNNYVYYLGVCIKSLICNTSTQYNYDIVILESNISDKNKNKILELKNKDNVSIRFCNVKSITENYKFFTKDYFTIETYYRLFIPSIFSQYEKVLYLDCDLVILHDVAQLYNINIKDNLLAATWNISTIVQAQTNQIIKGIPWKDYLEKELKLDNPINYFQAGVCLFNVALMIKENIQQKFLIRALSYNHPLVDQDVLNNVCNNRVLFFEQQWNYHNNFSESSQNINLLNLVPELQRKSYITASKKPYIIHYAGFIKPWHNPGMEFHDIWWQYARISPFYEGILYKNLTQNSPKNTTDTTILKDILNYERNKKKYFKYKLFSKILIGKKRKKYKEKYKEIKNKINKINYILEK